MEPRRAGGAALVLLLVLITGCATQRARHATPSGFLGDYAGFAEGARGGVVKEIGRRTIERDP
jgi:hypothetical protein